MIFCKRKTCPAETVTEFEMPLSCLKWKVKNFTDGDIYVSIGTYDGENNMRIGSGMYDILVDRNSKTGTRQTSRCVQVYADVEGEVEVVYV